jgi:hypothetical protein
VYTVPGEGSARVLPIANKMQLKAGHGPFSLSVVQAINDWQRGGDAKQKKRRGEALKRECRSLPGEFRQCESLCYRQIALPKGSVWSLLVEDALAEKVSAWTTELAVSEKFKGGVPPEGQGYCGVIFAYIPKPENVVVNLSLVYQDPHFNRACEDLRPRINGYADGIGRYGNEQSEVVLKMQVLTQNDLHSFGGHSSPFDELVELTAHLMYGRAPSTKELQDLRQKVEHVRDWAGPAWLPPDATQRVLSRLAPHADLLAAIKKLQDSLKVEDH